VISPVNFLLARIAEDEEWAKLSAGPDYSDAEEGTPGHSARVLAECRAKRRIVADLRQIIETGQPVAAQAAWAAVRTLCHLTIAYADHPDFDESWRL
jgi:hypothetical protein